MHLYLQSKSSYSKILVVDSTNYSNRIVGREALATNGKLMRINGIFDFIGNKLLSLFAINGILILRINDENLPVDDLISVNVSGSHFCRTLTIEPKNSDSIRISYKINNPIVDIHDPTPFIDDEDEDFGLFLSNVISDNARRHIALERWSSSIISQ